MESNLITQQTPDLTTNSELSFEIYKEAIKSGFVIRYDSIEYRGEELNFLSDVSGVHCVAQWQGNLVDLGLNNIYYKEDMCKFVDRKLDLITTFPKSPELQGAKLEWFRNGDARDIRLSYRGRILEVFLVSSPALLDINSIMNESKAILYKSGLLDEI